MYELPGQNPHTQTRRVGHPNHLRTWSPGRLVAQVALDLSGNANLPIGVREIGLQNRRRDAGATRVYVHNAGDNFHSTNARCEIPPGILLGGIAVSKRGESWF